MLHIRYDGELTDAGLLEGFAEDLEAMKRHAVRNVIVDLGCISSLSVKSQTNLRLAGSGAFPKGTRLVFVAPCDVQFGMARMFELAAEAALSGEIFVVRSVAEAYAELGIPEEG